MHPDSWAGGGGGDLARAGAVSAGAGWVGWSSAMVLGSPRPITRAGSPARAPPRWWSPLFRSLRLPVPSPVAGRRCVCLVYEWSARAPAGRPLPGRFVQEMPEAPGFVRGRGH
ncbi:unnamed protein product [Amoebophrya sp. A120]|nr:unnamed protein product [Amoebophrya sp. A120]|eukprot:GSA120T00000314001.1